jgi:hypothetical protein
VTAAIESKLISLLSDPLWRLNHLYNIIDKSGEKKIFKLNWAQEELYRGMFYCNIILKARQLGISTFICLLFLDRCLFNSNVAAGILCHTLEDSQHMFKRIKFAYDCLPEEIKALRAATVDSARELHFSNGSSLRVGTSMRGSTFQYLHVSEFGKICSHYPEKAREIITGSLNTLAAGQYCFIESTAEGRDGRFYEMCKQAQALKDSGKKLTELDFKFFFFPWWQCPDYSMNQPVEIPKELEGYFRSLEDKKIELKSEQKFWYVKKLESQSEDMKREYPSTPAESFQAAVDGAYYSKWLSKARMEGRISRVYHESELPVHTAWDLGYGDSTAIWFFQCSGKEIHLIDYYENSGEALTHYLKYLKDKEYSYGAHLVPHDAAVHEFSTGLSRVEVARKNGLTFTIAPNLEIDVGIDAVRNILNRCWFDEQKCALGFKSLDAYRRAWNEKQGCWSSKPLHNATSHGADAFRMLAVGLQFITDRELTAEDLDKIHREALGIPANLGGFFNQPNAPYPAPTPYGF